MLLDFGSDLDAQGGFFGTALQAAAKAGNLEGVEMLLTRGVDVNLRCGEYGGALSAARSADRHYCLKCYGFKRLSQAEYGCKDIIQVLLDAGATE